MCQHVLVIHPFLSVSLLWFREKLFHVSVCNLSLSLSLSLSLLIPLFLYIMINSENIVPFFLSLSFSPSLSLSLSLFHVIQNLEISLSHLDCGWEFFLSALLCYENIFLLLHLSFSCACLYSNTSLHVHVSWRLVGSNPITTDVQLSEVVFQWKVTRNQYLHYSLLTSTYTALY